MSLLSDGLRQSNSTNRSNDRREEVMCSVLLLRHFDARKPSSVAQVRRQSGERAAKLRCFGSLILPALAALVVLAGGAMAQGQEVSAPILSSGMRGTAPVQTQAFGNLSQRPAAEHLFDAQNMPPIDSIGATSDIRPFLASGVPEDLTRRRFAERGRPIRRSAISSVCPRIPGTPMRQVP